MLILLLIKKYSFFHCVTDDLLRRGCFVVVITRGAAMALIERRLGVLSRRVLEGLSVSYLVPFLIRG